MQSDHGTTARPLVLKIPLSEKLRQNRTVPDKALAEVCTPLLLSRCDLEMFPLCMNVA